MFTILHLETGLMVPQWFLNRVEIPKIFITIHFTNAVNEYQSLPTGLLTVIRNVSLAYATVNPQEEVRLALGYSWSPFPFSTVFLCHQQLRFYCESKRKFILCRYVDVKQNPTSAVPELDHVFISRKS